MSLEGVLSASWEVVESWFSTACDVVRGVRREAEPLIDRLRRGEPRPEPASSTRGTALVRDVEQEVRETKYGMPRRGPAAIPATAPLAGPGLLDQERDTLPKSYGTDRVVVLARDPWSLFVYWEVTELSRLAALEGLGADSAYARAVVRVDAVPGGGHSMDGAPPLSVDVEPTRDGERLYVNGLEPGTTYRIEVGLRTATGRFVSLARSNTVTTPAAQPSADTGIRWADLRTEGVATDGTWSPATPPSNGAAPEPPLPPAR